MEIAVRTLAFQLRTITCYSQPLPEGLFPLQSVYPELEEEAMRIVEERRGLFIYVVTTSLACIDSMSAFSRRNARGRQTRGAV